MRKLVLLVILVAVVGGGAWAYMTFSVKANNGVKEALDRSLKTLPPGWTASYKSIDVGLAAQEAVVKGFELHGPAGTIKDATIDEIDITSPALDLDKSWATAAANAAILKPEQPLPVVDGVAIKGLTIHSDDPKVTVEIKVGAVQMTKIRVYPWALMKIDQPMIDQVKALLAQPPNQSDPEAMMPVLRLEAAALLGYGYDGYTIDDVAVTATGPGPDGAPQTVVITVKHGAGTGVDRGKMASFAVDGIHVAAMPELDMTVDHATMAGLDVQQPFNKIMANGTLDPTLLDGLTLTSIEYKGMTVKAQDSPPMTMGSIGFSNIAFGHGLMTSADFAVSGVKVSKALVTDEQMLDGFNKLGIDTATISFSAGYRWDTDKKTAVLKEASFKIDELGALTLSADLAGIDKADTLEQTATLNHAKLRYDDASFAGRAIKVAAQDNGQDPAAFKQQLTGMVQMQSAMLGKSPAITAAAKAVGTFINDPHNLTIELAPPQPVALATLEDDKDLPPDQIFSKLGVKVTANQ